MKFLKQLAKHVESYNDGTLPSETVRNLRLLIISVMIGQICFGTTGGSAFPGYIKALGATDFMLGLLMAAPFCVRVVQIIASYILERTKKRKFLMCAIGITSRLLWVPVGLVPLLIPMEQPMLRLWSILVLYALNAMSGTFIDSCFMSLCADVVPMKIRGRFFSVRSKFSMVVSILAGLLISYLLDHITGYNGLLGYMICFVMAGIFGAADIFTFLFMRFPPMEGEGQKERQSIFSMVMGVLRDGPFMRLVLFWTVWGFSVNIVAPYFSVYMLEHLGMTFMQITLLSTIAANVFSFLFINRWGGMMDSYGYKPVLRVCATIGSFLPLIWIFSAPGKFVLPVLIVQCLSGAVWPAIDLSAQNTIMNAAPARNRSMYTAMYMVVMQLFGVALGYITGGFLLDNVYSPAAASLAEAGWSFFGYTLTRYHFLMITSTVLRFCSAQFILPLARLDPGVSTLAVLREIGGNTRASARRNFAMLRGQMMRKSYHRRAKKNGGNET